MNLTTQAIGLAADKATTLRSRAFETLTAAEAANQAARVATISTGDADSARRDNAPIYEATCLAVDRILVAYDLARDVLTAAEATVEAAEAAAIAAADAADYARIEAN